MHRLEQDFELSACEILDVICRHSRCLTAVKGAVAEEHLARHLEMLRARGDIQGFTALDKDGQPDFVIPFKGREFRLECKNVRKERPGRGIEIDFKRTRNPTGKRNKNRGAEGRFYSPDEFDILAACLWTRTGRWEFAFVATRDLPPHSVYTGRLSDEVTVPLNQGILGAPWAANLAQTLDRLSR